MQSSSFATELRRDCTHKPEEHRLHFPDHRRKPKDMKSFLASVTLSSILFTAPCFAQSSSAEAESPISKCLSAPDRLARQADWLKQISGLEKGDFPKAAQILEGLIQPSRSLQWEWEVLWIQWTRRDPETALVEGMKPRERGKYGVKLRDIMFEWAGKDAASARKWLEADPIRSSDAGLTQGFLDGFANTDISGATEFIVKHPSPGTNGALAQLCNSVFTSGGEATMMKWWESLPAPEAKTDAKVVAAASVAGKLATVDLRKAAAFWKSMPRPLYDGNTVPMMLAGRMARELSPLEALEWAASMPPTAGSKSYPGVGTAAEIWAESDPDGFAKWLVKNRDFPAIDAVLFGFVRYLGRKDPVQARKWLNEIKDEKERETARIWIE